MIRQVRILIEFPDPGNKGSGILHPPQDRRQDGVIIGTDGAVRLTAAQTLNRYPPYIYEALVMRDDDIVVIDNKDTFG